MNMQAIAITNMICHTFLCSNSDTNCFVVAVDVCSVKSTNGQIPLSADPSAGTRDTSANLIGAVMAVVAAILTLRKH